FAALLPRLSFPPRRSSDLLRFARRHAAVHRLRGPLDCRIESPAPMARPAGARVAAKHPRALSLSATADRAPRRRPLPLRCRGIEIEEHTSELQSRENLVCR